jgi:hypothetical protein
MRVIADDLHCNAVRVSGGDAGRLAVAGRYAAEAGLEVWLAPFPSDLTPEEMLPFFADCAEHAETLRRGGAEVVFVTGCELSLFAKGFLPGEDAYDRIEGVMSGAPEVVACANSWRSLRRREWTAPSGSPSPGTDCPTGPTRDATWTSPRTE